MTAHIPSRGTTCRSCGAPVEFVKTPRGKAQILDAAPVDDGNVVIENGLAVAYQALIHGDLPRRRDHHATCPNADDFRRRRCCAKGCPRTVTPNVFMCKRHWFMVPKSLRNRIWKSYRPGQTAATASPEWHEAARLAIASVAESERQ